MLQDLREDTAREGQVDHMAYGRHQQGGHQVQPIAIDIVTSERLTRFSV